MTQQQLERLVKNAASKMRADDNTKGVTKYLEHFSWLLFLKVFEQVEDALALEAEVDGRHYERVIDGDYRWSVWTQSGLTGDDLVAFVNDKLFPHLRELGGSAEAETVARVFGGVSVVMKSGYSLAEVIEIIDRVEFHTPEDYHTMTVLYETLLAEMGTEAGWSGEFYTPRPIVEFMTTVVNPSIGETVYDPASGSCGFLVAAYEHMSRGVETLDQHGLLQRRTFFGQDSGELPYLLGTMNMMLHGLLVPNNVRRNTVERDIRSIGPEEQHDVVLTNPPFGGKENPQVQHNFPIRSSATEVLFLQHVIAMLKPKGRCGIVAPGGVLFDDDASFRTLRRKLINECNLHTVVRLPPGSFPTTPHQRLNLLFFDREGPTKEIWFYEHPVPEHRRHLKHPRYTKTNPLRFEEFEPLIAWWGNRTETEWAWRVSVADLDDDLLDLDLHHPDRPPHVEVVSVKALSTELEEAAEVLYQYGQTMQESAAVVEDMIQGRHPVRPLQALDVAINPENRDPRNDPDQPFIYIDLSSVDRGVINPGEPILGREAPSRARRVVRENDVLFSTVRPYLRGHGLVGAALEDAIASTGFAVLRPGDSLDANYLLLALMTPLVVQQCVEAMKGAHYPALRVEQVQALEIPFPQTVEQQREIVEAAYPVLEKARNQRLLVSSQLEDLLDTVKDSEFSLLELEDDG